MRSRRALLALSAAGAAFAAVHRTDRRGRPRPAVLAGRPLLIAHRGGAGLAPENTLHAFRNGLETWQADMLEFDVRATADGRCVVIHDETVDRTTDGTGDVADMTLAELQALDAGYHFTRDGRTFPFRAGGVRVPTIEEVFETFPHARMTIEVKTGAAQAPLFDAIHRFGATDRVVLGGMHTADRTMFRTHHSGATSPAVEQLRPFVMLRRLGLGALWRLAGDTVQVPERFGNELVVTPGFIEAVHRQGIDVHVWTVDARADMERLLDWGVDGIITDRPDVLGTLLYERAGRPLAPGHGSGAGG